MPHDLFVFGSNGEGQLGEGLPVADIVSRPTILPRLPIYGQVAVIKSGDNHTLLHVQSNFVYGIGDNRQGQIVATAMPRTDRWTIVHEKVDFVAAACESSAIIQVCKGASSSILTRGRGQWGELGCDEEEKIPKNHYDKPWNSIDLPGEVADFAAGVWHYVAVLSDGSVYGWGKARLGQLGSKYSNKITTPTKIEGVLFKPARVVCGKDFTYLVGDPSAGEHMVLGKDKFNIISGMPSDVKGYKEIGATWHAIFVLFNDGRLLAWGKENQWKLLPPDLPPIETIAVGTDHILAVTKEGTLISWGWAKHGNCGDLSNLRQEVKNDMVSGFWNEINIPGKITKIAAGYCTSFVITEVEEDEPNNIQTTGEQ